MPRPILTPSPTGTASTWQIGSYNAVNDTFTQVLDLNDRVTWFVKSYDIPQPEKVVARSGNPRTNGERITNERYKNRYITLTLQLRSTTTLAALDTAIHALEAAIDTTPFMLRLAEAQAAQYSYAIVKSWIHNIPQDPLQRLAKAKTGITIIFECEPGLLGDKLYLDNLVVNPGFEAPSGPAVTVFNDSFANTNAYTVQAGSAPTLASNVMTIAAGSRVAIGSPAWGALNLWQVRFKWVTGLSADFMLHITNASNLLRCNVTGTSISLAQTIAGTNNTLASSAPTLTNGSFYWLQVTQFPTVPGSAPYVQATLFNDSAGAIGSAVTSGAVGPVATADAVTALSGVSAMQANGAALAVGGAFSNVHRMQLFGPGGWSFLGLNGTATGQASLGWEQNTANTYPNGPVTSYGAARIDLPPAGTVDARLSSWDGTGGATGAAQFAFPTAQNHVLGFSLAYLTTAGLSATSTVKIVFKEVNSSGADVTTNAVTILNGTTQTTWATFSGTYTVQNAAAVFVRIQLNVMDSTANSANATVWFDNVQLWDQTALNGQTSMPYCELRFPQSPAQLLVSGLVGDLAVPAYVALGTFLSSWSGNNTLPLVLGRRQYSTAAAQLVMADVADPVNGGPPALDSSSYGGYYSKSTGGYADHPLFGHPGDLQGVYHLWSRYFSGQAAGQLPNVTTNVLAYDQNTSQVYVPSAANVLWAYSGPTSAPLTASTAWTPADAGLVMIPLVQRGSLVDLQQNYVVVGAGWTDASPPASNRLNWQALIPIDGSVLAVTANNPNGNPAVTNSWFWQYVDGLPTQGGATQGATSYSIETTPLPNPAHGSGGPGTLSSFSINVNPTADPYLTLDPTVQIGSTSVNQLAGFLSDVSGDVLPLHAQIAYIPLYLDPR